MNIIRSISEFDKMYNTSYDIFAQIFMKKVKINKRIKELLELDRKIKNLPELSPIEKAVLDKEQSFEAIYYSNKLEGNKLSKQEARKAVLLGE